MLTLQHDGVTYYFLDNKYYFGRPYIYGLGGDEYERYAYFCRAALNALPLIGFQPDVIHAHDWQAGMMPALLKIQYQHLPFYAPIRTLFTIHNLQYQGIFGIKEVQDVMGFGDGLWSADKLEFSGCANFMKAGLVYTDIITTVSPSYAEEITTAYYGERLDGLIRSRKNALYGVLNGIDTDLYNPAVDRQIEHTYTAEDLSGKAADKDALQKELGLEADAGYPADCDDRAAYQPEGVGSGGLCAGRYHGGAGPAGDPRHGRSPLYQPFQLGGNQIPGQTRLAFYHGQRTCA